MERRAPARDAINSTSPPPFAAFSRSLPPVVFNLLSHAVRFTPAGGRVDISARADDGHVEIAVADTGPGIPADDLERVFEEFEQSSDGKKVEGTGLGLPLSRKLVELPRWPAVGRERGRLWQHLPLHPPGRPDRARLSPAEPAATLTWAECALFRNGPTGFLHRWPQASIADVRAAQLRSWIARETQMHPDAQVVSPESSTFKVHLCLAGYGGE